MSDRSKPDINRTPRPVPRGGIACLRTRVFALTAPLVAGLTAYMAGCRDYEYLVIPSPTITVTVEGTRGLPFSGTLSEIFIRASATDLPAAPRPFGQRIRAFSGAGSWKRCAS